MGQKINKIACIGEVMIELVSPDGQTANIGTAGDTYNTAVYLKRMHPDADVSYVTALGTDQFSDRMMEAMQAEDINTASVERRADRTPGLYAITTDAQGERSFTYWRSTSAARTLFTAPCKVGLERLGDFELILLTGISIAILPQSVRTALYAAIDAYRAAGGIVVFDSNYRPKLWASRAEAQEQTMRMWARCDVALPSVDDEMELFGDSTDADVIARLAGVGATNGALKRGAVGPLDLATGTQPDALSKIDTVVDSTAAGDSFNAGYLATFCQGGDGSASIRAGHDLAAKVIQHRGAIIPRGV